MSARAFAVAGALVVAALLLMTMAARPGRSPEPSEPALGSGPGGVSGLGPSGTPSPYTFDDEFDGTALGPAWQRHFSCCGDLTGFDPALASVSNGLLTIAAERRPGGWYADLIDTKTTFEQAYGLFEARIRIPSGQGLWPAFWSYRSGGGQQAEIDTMEVCGTAAGSGGSVLHNSVYWSQRQSQSHTTPTADLSAGFHVYAVDWRPDSLTFLLDGQVVWEFTDTARIPQVPMPIILDLGVGGDFCGPPDASTPDRAAMEVDWVRVSP